MWKESQLKEQDKAREIAQTGAEVKYSRTRCSVGVREKTANEQSAL